MVLRLVSDPMLEKSSRTESLADRQKILLRARFRIFLFFGFSTTRETENFQKISREFRKIPGIPKIPGIRRFTENFRGKFFRV